MVSELRNINLNLLKVFSLSHLKMFSNLPLDIQRYICTFLNIRDYVNLQRTSKRFSNLLPMQQYLSAFFLFEPCESQREEYLKLLIQHSTLQTFNQLFRKIPEPFMDLCFDLTLKFERVDLTQYMIEHDAFIRNKLAERNRSYAYDHVSNLRFKIRYFNDYAIITDDEWTLNPAKIIDQKAIYELLLKYYDKYTLMWLFMESNNFYGMVHLVGQLEGDFDNTTSYIMHYLAVDLLTNNTKESFKCLLFQLIKVKTDELTFCNFYHFLDWIDRSLILLLFRHFPIEGDVMEIVRYIATSDNPELMELFCELDLNNLKLSGNYIVTHTATELSNETLGKYLLIACESDSLDLVKYILPRVNFTVELAHRSFRKAVEGFAVVVIDFFFTDFGFDVWDLCLIWANYAASTMDPKYRWFFDEHEPMWFSKPYISIMDKWGGHKYFSAIYGYWCRVYGG